MLKESGITLTIKMWYPSSRGNNTVSSNWNLAWLNRSKDCLDSLTLNAAIGAFNLGSAVVATTVVFQAAGTIFFQSSFL